MEAASNPFDPALPSVLPESESNFSPAHTHSGVKGVKREREKAGFGGAGRAGRGNNGVQREGIASRVELEAALPLLLLRKLAGAAIMRLSRVFW